MTGGVPSLLHRCRGEGGEADDITDGVDVRDGGLEIFVDFQPAPFIGLNSDALQVQPHSGTNPSDGVHQQGRADLLAAFQMDCYRVVLGLFNANDFLVEAKRHADAPHLILQSFN